MQFASSNIIIDLNVLYTWYIIASIYNITVYIFLYSNLYTVESRYLEVHRTVEKFRVIQTLTKGDSKELNKIGNSVR